MKNNKVLTIVLICICSIFTILLSIFLVVSIKDKNKFTFNFGFLKKGESNNLIYNESFDDINKNINIKVSSSNIYIKNSSDNKATLKMYGSEKSKDDLKVTNEEDLNINVHINMVPIVREESGLARSSRNQYLSADEKKAALVLSRSLKAAKMLYADGENKVAELKKVVSDILEAEPMAKVDYVELYSFPGLLSIEEVKGPALLAIAVKIGKTRLIDNVILGKE